MSHWTLKEKDIILVVACDSNKDIELTDSAPFLTTAWRISILSYLPYLDYICSSGDFERIEDADSHWAYKYKALRPDFVDIEEGGEYAEKKAQRTIEAGAKPLYHHRETQYLPGPGQILSSSSIHAGNVGDMQDGHRADWNYTNPYLHLLTIKQIRDLKYGKRKLF